VIYLSNGPHRSYRIGNTMLTFEHTTLKETEFKLRKSQLIVQALKSICPDRISPEVIARIQSWLPPPRRAKVVTDTKTASGWIRSALLHLSKEGQTDG